ncbi:pyridoxamine 5'-phosphate oxidase family protein [Streptomyces sp. NPDC005438]|uniref:pyridoxamine 5'-phosphate oxidase family protein n=1 Tax=Streptomyces sp. NPDC005438 TaxID=3156880 RepID=UPI0033B70137
MDTHPHRELDRDQSLALLAGMHTGRVIYTAQALPAVLPVRFRVAPDGDLLLEGYAPASLLVAADGGLLAFETGEIADLDGRGWSVTVLGRASLSYDSRRPVPAEGGAGRVVIRLCPELVTGHRLGTPAVGPG